MSAGQLADEGQLLRHGDVRWLERSLRAARADTLARFAAWEEALGAAPELPERDDLNPPLWELGHVGWFQEFWLTRNPAWRAGAAADPAAPRLMPLRFDADALYDSGRVPHATRWHLPLPDATQTRAELSAQLEQTLELLRQADGSDAQLYFFRLALAHEDMHHEAALYMARSLGLHIDEDRWQLPALPAPAQSEALPAVRWRLGRDAGAPGFAFDNECGQLAQDLPPGRIDLQVLRWADYLPFIESGGYRQPSWWSAAGRAWLTRHPERGAALLRQRAAPDRAASHLCAHEAEAWCAWAGRRLPSEAEWERAALSLGADFRWGQVWEWTASDFQPWPGFVPHPYRDYSAPWFGRRRVLRGASVLTQPRMRHPLYRNFFDPDRSDICAGFRSCADTG